MSGSCNINMLLIMTIMVAMLPTLAITKVCKSTHTDIQGIISTPNFPQKFATPIDCVWIIENSNYENSRIIVYFTQLFVMEGLTMECYNHYWDHHKYKYHNMKPMPPKNVNQNSQNLVCPHQYLKIRLKLDHIEGTHVRVLDNLLDVFGFNITYEISESEGPRDGFCTMAMCGYTGNCYDHFTHFKCHCFPGYSGKTCSGDGIKSQCYANGQPVCKNEAKCIHLGEAAIKCTCNKGFIGERCEIIKKQQPLSTAHNLISCPYDEANVCKCSTASTTPTSGLIGFSSSVLIKSNATSLNPVSLKIYLAEYITQYLKAEDSTGNMQNVNILYLNYLEFGIEVAFQFYASPKDEPQIRHMMDQWLQKGTIGNNLTLASNETRTFNDIFTTNLPLLLKSVATNKANDVLRETDEIVLSCVARGSVNMVFRWYKNYTQVNIIPGVIKYKWTRLIQNDEKNEYTSLLGIGRASQYDEGLFTCQVEDFGEQQCRSIFVRLQERVPNVWLNTTSSITVQQGTPFSITCSDRTATSTAAARGGYDHRLQANIRRSVHTWTKDKQLLKAKTNSENYEMLYPMGSILRVSGIHKSTVYSCRVQRGQLSAEKFIRVEIADSSSNSSGYCASEYNEGYFWQETMVGLWHHQLPLCPESNYTAGVVTRHCNAISNSWMPPDYSNCIAKALKTPILQFWLLTHGYEATTVLDTLIKYLHYVQSGLLKNGEAHVILHVLQHALDFSQSDVRTFKENLNTTILINVTRAAIEICNHLLDPSISAINKEQEVISLQNMLKAQVTLLAYELRDLSSCGNTSSSSSCHMLFDRIQLNISVELIQSEQRHINGGGFALQQQPPRERGEQEVQEFFTVKLVRLVYMNLPHFLMSKSTVRLKREDYSDVEYQVCSEIVALWLEPLSSPFSGYTLHRYRYNFTNANVTNDDGQIIQRCAMSTVAGSGHVWDTNHCHASTASTSTSRVECTCSSGPNGGTMALLLINRNTLLSYYDGGTAGEDGNCSRVAVHPYLVIIASSFCLLLALATCIVLTYRIICSNSGGILELLLEVQSCVSVSVIQSLVLISAHIVPAPHNWLFMGSCLQASFFLGLSSPLSTVLIAYSSSNSHSCGEFYHYHAQQRHRKSIVCVVVTAGPLLIVCANHLAHEICDIRLSQWWLVYGTLSFNVFIGCAFVMIVMFAVLVCLSLIAITAEMPTNCDGVSTAAAMTIKNGRVVSLLVRTSIVFASQTMLAFSSLLYANLPPSNNYYFSSTAAIFSLISLVMGVVLVLCLAMHKPRLHIITFDQRISAMIIPDHQQNENEADDITTEPQISNSRPPPHARIYMNNLDLTNQSPPLRNNNNMPQSSSSTPLNATNTCRRITKVFDDIIIDNNKYANQRNRACLATASNFNKHMCTSNITVNRQSSKLLAAVEMDEAGRYG